VRETKAIALMLELNFLDRWKHQLHVTWNERLKAIWQASTPAARDEAERLRDIHFETLQWLYPQIYRLEDALVAARQEARR
jgi:hypothetical protein